MKKTFICILVAVVLSGCAMVNIKHYYRDNTGGVKDISKDSRWIAASGEPELRIGNNINEDMKKLAEIGYGVIGSCDFSGVTKAPVRSQALYVGKELRASLVMLYIHSGKPVIGEAPMTLPNMQTANTQIMGNVGNTPISGSAITTTYGTQTTYIPYALELNDYVIVFLAKIKSRIGIYYNDLTSEDKKQIGSNKGVVVKSLIKGSPAFEADIIDGDIIKKLNGAEVIDAEQFGKLLDENNENKISLTFIRGGKEMTKTIQLNSSPEKLN